MSFLLAEVCPISSIPQECQTKATTPKVGGCFSRVSEESTLSLGLLRSNSALICLGPDYFQRFALCVSLLSLRRLPGVHFRSSVIPVTDVHSLSLGVISKLEIPILPQPDMLCAAA